LPLKTANRKGDLLHTQRRQSRRKMRYGRPANSLRSNSAGR
jgi:hypothetical protein